LQGIQGLTGPTGATGSQGPIGLTGATGTTGAQGPAGTNGTNGSNGLSAYQIWLNAGNTGTETQFLTNLQGTTGLQGIQGVTGTAGATGPQGPAGTNGTAVLNGTTIPTSSTGVNGDFYIDTTTNTLYGPKANGAWASGTALVGPTGATGPQGTAGNNGLSAYQIWLNAGNTGNEAQFLASLQGTQGPAGPQGPAGSTPAGLGIRIGFDSDSNWICPTGVTSIVIELWGGGGANGNGGWCNAYCNQTMTQPNYGNGGSGGRGGYLKTTITVVPGTSYSIIIGNYLTNSKKTYFGSYFAEGGGNGGNVICNGGCPFTGSNGVNGSVIGYVGGSITVPTYIPAGYITSSSPSCCANIQQKGFAVIQY
jgi:hypothetical protein